MATKSKKEDPKKKGSKEKDPEKEAKRKARMEALKNRPAEQRPNSKQIDVIAINDKSKVMNYGYAVKNKEGYQGVVVTSVLVTMVKQSLLQWLLFRAISQLSQRKATELSLLPNQKRRKRITPKKNQKIND